MTYLYRTSALCDQGEFVAGPPTTTITWPEVEGAIGYKVYMRAAPPKAYSAKAKEVAQEAGRSAVPRLSARRRSESAGVGAAMSPKTPEEIRIYLDWQRAYGKLFIVAVGLGFLNFISAWAGYLAGLGGHR